MPSAGHCGSKAEPECSTSPVDDDAAGFVSDEPVDVAACLGATWIGNGVAGTAELLARSLRPGGIMLIGEPYWRRSPSEEAAQGSGATGASDFRLLPELIEEFGALGYDTVDAVLSHAPHFRDWFADAAVYATLMERLQQEDRVSDFECQFVRHDGKTIWVSQQVLPLPSTNDQEAAYWCLVEDITEQRTVEAALQHEQSLMNALMNSVADSIYFKDLD